MMGLLMVILLNKGRQIVHPHQAECFSIILIIILIIIITITLIINYMEIN